MIEMDEKKDKQTNLLDDSRVEHDLIKKFQAHGHFQHFSQEIVTSLIPRKDTLPTKFNISIHADKEPVSFRSASHTMLGEIIEHLCLIYYKMMNVENKEQFIKDSDHFIEKLRILRKGFENGSHL